MSRNHATIELTDSGEVFLTSTHVNPSYYYLESDTNGQKVLKKDKSTQLNSGDAFSLLQSTYKFKVVIAEGEAAPMPAKTENGASENKSNAVAAKNGDSGVNGKGSDGPKEEAASTSEKAKPKKPAAKVAKEEDEEFEEEEEEDDDDEEEDAPPKGRGKYTKGRPPRMATTAPGKLTKVDDDDYEDDWQEDEDDDDDDYNHQSASDSDWEMDTKGRSSTRGRGRRRDDSDDDSDEDWGSSKKKKKTPKKPARKPTRRAPARGARKGRKQKYESDEEEEEEEELDEDEEEETPKKSKKLKPCPEGKRCKKKNPAHLRDYSHDAASDDEDDDDIDEDEEEDVKKKPSKATARGGSGGGRPKREAATKGNYSFISLCLSRFCIFFALFASVYPNARCTNLSRPLSRGENNEKSIRVCKANYYCFKFLWYT